MVALRKALLVALLAVIGQSGPASAQAVVSDKLIATIVIAGAWWAAGQGRLPVRPREGPARCW